MDVADVCVESRHPDTGETALCAACTNARSDTVQFLLLRGANIAATTTNSAPTAEGAAFNHNRLTRKSALICAVASGSWDLVVSLLARGLDANGERDEFGVTPLMTAAMHGHVGLIELLIGRGTVFVYTSREVI
jgi:ankyrin repeat protein